MSRLNLLAIDIGHNVNHDTGAVGIRNEDQLNRLVGYALIKKCIESGIKVVNCLPESANSLSDSLNKRCEIANKNNADLFISIHHNAGGGFGAEALAYKKGLGSQVGKAILGKLGRIRIKNRGVKMRKDLAVLRNTVMPAVLIECAFVDSIEDMYSYNPSKVADAIYKGICSVFEMEQAQNSLFHVVQEGETLSSISRKYGVSVDELVINNGINNSDLIFVNEKLRIQ